MNMALWNKIKKIGLALLCATVCWSCAKEVEPGQMIETTTGEILEKVENGETLVVYFGQTTCGHCIEYGPIVEQVCEEDGATIYKVMLDLSEGSDNLVLINEYGLEYTPTTYFFKDGEMITSFVGNVTAEELVDFLKEHGQL